MTERITADFETLVRQAPMLTENIMRQGAENIDRMFGDDNYSKKHPELLAAYMHCAMADFVSGVLAQQIRAGIDNLAESMPDTHDIGRGLHSVAGSVDNIACNMFDVHREIRSWVWDMILHCKPIAGGQTS